MCFLFLPNSPCDAENGQVVGLRSAGGEDDLAGPGADQPRHLFPGGLYTCLRFLTEPVDGGSVPEIQAEKRLHGLKDFRGQGRGRIVIEIDASHVDCRIRRAVLRAFRQRGRLSRGADVLTNPHNSG